MSSEPPAKPRGHAASSEREILADSLLKQYRPLKYLRPEQKHLLKTAWSFKQGYDGTKLECSFCKQVFQLPGVNVHHCDGDDTHNEIENLAPACWDCNQREKVIVRRRKSAEASKKERERISEADVHGDTEVKDKPTEIERNEEGEPEVRMFVIEHILIYGRNPSEDQVRRMLKPGNVLNAASNYAGPNPKTCYPYFNRMTNPINGFVRIARHPKYKVKYLTFYHDEYFNMTPEEIVALNPKEGLIKRSKVPKEGAS